MKTAIVTGVSYGLGEAISGLLLKFGYKVYGVSRSKPKFDDDQHIWIKADLTNDGDLAVIINNISEEKIDLLVNNAGTAFEQKALEYTDADFDRIFSLNFKTPIKLTKSIFPKLTGGVVINISSLSDRYPEQMLGLYCASKTALNLFFECLAIEESNVKIISILPTYINTPLLQSLPNTKPSDMSQALSPDNVADCIEQVINNIDQLQSGTRVAIEVKDGDNAPYNPEKLYVYTTDTKKLNKVR